MSLFKSEKFISGAGVDLALVAQELVTHFQERKYEVTSNQIDAGIWDVSITRGGLFKQALGLKSALKIELEEKPTGTFVRAGAGVFGKQAASSVISMFVAWPVLLTQVWGLIREAGLDDEAVRVVELSIARMLRSPGPATPSATGEHPAGDNGVRIGPGAKADPTPTRFCPSCGAEGAPGARFCSACGAARVSA